MKLFILLAGIFTLTISADSCNKKEKSAEVYKGKLEVKALCMNYTISVIEGEIDPSLVVTNWTDENTNKPYKNAFGLKDPCTFPSTIKEGEEFYFSIDTALKGDCAVCMAYYPTPEKKLLIKVVNKE